MNVLFSLPAQISLGSIGWIYALSPESFRRGYAFVLGKFLSIINFRRTVIESNLERAERAFHSGTLKPMKMQTELVYRRMASLFLEIFLVFGGMRFFLEKNSVVRGLENIEKAKSQRRPILYLTSHIGNWEIAVAASANASVDFLMVTKRLKPAWLHELIEKRRKSYGVTATYEPKTLKDVLRWLKNKRGVGFILDQYAGPPIGVRVPFFGTYVGTSSAFATLVKRTGAAVVPVVNHKDKSGKYVTEFFSEIPWISCEDLQEEICLNTAQYSKFIEQQIEKHPSQWLWTHRRFKGELGPLKTDEWKSTRNRGDRKLSADRNPQSELPKN